jgi:hypothetical protein
MMKNTTLPLRSLWLVAVVLEFLLKLSHKLGRIESSTPINTFMGAVLGISEHMSGPKLPTHVGKVFTLQIPLVLSCVSRSLLIRQRKVAYLLLGLLGLVKHCPSIISVPLRNLRRDDTIWIYPDVEFFLICRFQDTSFDSVAAEKKETVRASVSPLYSDLSHG